MENIDINNNIEPDHVKFIFKNYYHTHPQFRTKHIQYMGTHINCECGQSIIRSYKSRHYKTVTHSKRMNKLKNIAIDTTINENEIIE